MDKKVYEDYYEEYYGHEDSEYIAYFFISYARENELSCRKFVKALNSKGFYTWVDKELKVGDYWRSHITEKIKNSEGVILILTSASVMSEGCRAEWTYALNSGIPIYPVIAEKCDVPRELRDIHWIDKATPYPTIPGFITEINQALEFAVSDLYKSLGGKEHPAYSRVLKDYYSFSESATSDRLALWNISDGILGPLKIIFHFRKYLELKKHIVHWDVGVDQTKKRVNFEFTARGWR